ncbi:MAG: AMP-binding protein [Chloroflexota bacterium]|nr:AMP-binding protein [Chloroflexota bacterium]MDE2839728.1 AMP-binding protein [Chloroflexota bacterium]MDE2931895.1 AMP-binding protein [Chloroflexota bacterium]
MQTLNDLLETAASRFSDSPALVIKPGIRVRSWSYREIWEASGKVAAYLHGRGITKGDRVVIWAPNRPEWVVALFGCLRLGAIAVPFDIRSAPEFVAGVLGQTDPKFAFVSQFTPENAAIDALPHLNIEDLEGVLHDETSPPPRVEVAGDDIAEIMFTSGTTGAPKGVILTHGNIIANVLAGTQEVAPQPHWRLLSILPLSHMLEQTVGLFASLVGGGRVVYPASRQPSILVRTMQENGITSIVLVPQALELFMNAIEREAERTGKKEQLAKILSIAPKLPIWLRRKLFGKVHKRFGGKLWFVMCGGARLDPPLAEKWEALGVIVLQGYGTTEAAPIVACNSFRYKKLDALGKVLPGQEVRIAEDGEIQTRGPNVTQGYWQQPEITEASFDGEWYKTGDLGYIDEDGFLYFKGRKKDLIVLANGQNVYPEDIEPWLQNHPAIEDAVVVGMPSPSGGEDVHAVLIPSEGGVSDGVSDGGAVVADVNPQLAAHQQIRGFTLWPEEEFPRTHTLKVKKNLVLERLIADAEGKSEAAAAPAEVPKDEQTPLEQLIVRICEVSPADVKAESILGADIGLDSLGRVELLSAIEQELGVYIDETQVHPESTVGDLETLLAQGSASEEERFPGWNRAGWCRAARAVLHSVIVNPGIRLLYRIQVDGKENLDGLTGPVLYAANHNLKLDAGMILLSLPASVRWRLAIAAAADNYFSSIWWQRFSPLLGNTFPFARYGPVRRSLENLGDLLDNEWSVLIFPEGDRTDGEIKAFKPGTGFVAMESRTPVVPIRVSLEKEGIYEGASFPSRGKVTVQIGKPLVFPPGTDYLEATETLEQAVREL